MQGGSPIMSRNRQETYEERRNRERRDTQLDSSRGPGHETYDEQLERWRRVWNEELERDFYK